MIFKTVYRSDSVQHWGWCLIGRLPLVGSWQMPLQLSARVKANASKLGTAARRDEVDPVQPSWTGKQLEWDNNRATPLYAINYAIISPVSNKPANILSQSTPIKTKTPGTHEETLKWPVGLDRSSFEGSPWNLISADWPASSNSKPGAHLPGWGLKASRRNTKNLAVCTLSAENFQKNNKDCWNGAALFLNIFFLKSGAILMEGT